MNTDKFCNYKKHILAKTDKEISHNTLNEITVKYKHHLKFYLEMFLKFLHVQISWVVLPFSTLVLFCDYFKLQNSR